MGFVVITDFGARVMSVQGVLDAIEANDQLLLGILIAVACTAGLLLISGLSSRQPATEVIVTELWIYPVKSCRGYRVDTIQADRSGFAWDRKFALMDKEGKLMTQKQVPELATLRPQPLDIAAGSLTIEADGLEPLTVPLRPGAAEVTPSQVGWMACKVPLPVLRYRASEAWLSRALPNQEGCALIQWDDENTRTLRNGRLAEVASAEDSCRLHDAAPLSIVSEASISALNSRLNANNKITCERFRPNVVVSGCSPFEECTWTSLSVGGATHRVLMEAFRCTMITIDLATGQRPHGFELTKILKGFRTVNDSRLESEPPMKLGPSFAMYFTLDSEHSSCRWDVGTKVRIEANLAQDCVSVYAHNKAASPDSFTPVPAAEWGTGVFWEISSGE